MGLALLDTSVVPDAVIVATGLRLGAAVILTADARWKDIETVRVVGGRR